MEQTVSPHQISIHAPVKGATSQATDAASMPLNFNPRSRKGSDARPSGSPHTYRYFNPRSRKGSDAKAASKLSTIRFQSTLP